jgi:putative nucleotidyltransferase with HDIG domain
MSMTRWVNIKECKEDYMIAEDIVHEDGSIIVSKYTVLNQHIVSMILAHGIHKIKIIGRVKKAQECNNKLYQNIKRDYEGIIRSLKDILCKLITGNNIETYQINYIMENLISHLEEGSMLLKVLEAEKKFDEYTYTHSLNVALYSMLIGKWLKLRKEDIKKVTIAGLLHDIGKTRVPYEILNKKGRLTEEEFSAIKHHSIYGYDIVNQYKNFSEDICQAILLHHERMDKSGYPYGYGEGQISLFSRVIAVADVYDAITTRRVYKAKATPFEAFEVLRTTEVKNLDINIVNVFMSNIATHYVGLDVLLNTGEVGEIVYIPPHNITNPIVKIGREYIDLSKIRDKVIVEII